jgi:hypothetical protein
MAINFANNSSLANITTLPASISGGGLTLVSSQTASSSASLEFSIDSTYDSYVFKFYNIHPSNDQVRFNVNFRDGSTAYDAVKTTTWFQAEHLENDSATALEYQSGNDLAQSTGVQIISGNVGNANDENISGTLHLFDPSSTTFIKHFMSRIIGQTHNEACNDVFCAGYCNTTVAIDGVQFSFASGNIDSGTIKMYGVA